MRLLKIISFHLLLTFGCSFDMQCDYIESSWRIVGRVNNCYVRNITVESHDDFVESVNGNTNKILKDILGFWVENETCHYIPQGISTFMPNLKALGLSNSGLRTISKFDLEPFPELIELSFYGNNLEYLDGDLFEQNTKIQSIDLEDNNLLIISGPILKPLEFLTCINLRLKCLTNKCEYSSCMRETKRIFSEKCEFESQYPGFTEYFQSLIRVTKKCDDV